MRKIVILLVAVMIFTCGCVNSNKEEITSLTKGEIPNERLVIRDGEVVSGRSSWDKFFAETTGAKEAGYAEMKREIYIDYYYSEDIGPSEDEEHYEMVLRFADGKYVYESITEETQVTYEYLIERSGKMKNAATGTRGYYLVNDENLTFDELSWSVLSSQSTDWIDHRVVFTDAIEE